MQHVGGGPVVTLQSMQAKIAIMRRKAQLVEVEIWIEDDHTARERDVEEWLKKEAEKKKGAGKSSEKDI